MKFRVTDRKEEGIMVQTVFDTPASFSVTNIEQHHFLPHDWPVWFSGVSSGVISAHSLRRFLPHCFTDPQAPR